jgi:hypothetical protein
MGLKGKGARPLIPSRTLESKLRSYSLYLCPDNSEMALFRKRCEPLFMLGVYPRILL